MRFCNGEGPALPFCGTIDPCNSTRPERGEEWFKKVLKEFKGTWTKVYERYRYQSGDHDAEDPVAEFMKFFGGDTIVLYAFIVFDHSDAMVGLLGKICSEESQCDTGFQGENQINGNSSTIMKKKRSAANQNEEGHTRKQLYAVSRFQQLAEDEALNFKLSKWAQQVGLSVKWD